MISLTVAVLTAITLTSPFGEATATAVETLDGAFVEVTVTVEIDTVPGPDFVVVHVLRPDGQDTFPLGPLGGGRYQGNFLVAPFNRAIAFEAGWGATPSALSKTTSLLALGVDDALLRTTFSPGDRSDNNAKWGWLALAAAALAVGALLIGLRLPKARGAMQLSTVDVSGDATVIDELTHPFQSLDDGL